VQTLSAIIQDAELAPPAERLVPTVDPIGSRHGRALCEAAVTLATAGQADAIVAVTREGKTARLLSALRPSAPVFAATAHPHVAGTLSLFWGVTPLLTDERNPEALERLLLAERFVTPGSVVVFINVSPQLDGTDSNFLNVQRIGS
jgi:pyruvate kinase